MGRRNLGLPATHFLLHLSSSARCSRLRSSEGGDPESAWFFALGMGGGEGERTSECVPEDPARAI
jgi:hypothetical protein